MLTSPEARVLAGGKQWFGGTFRAACEFAWSHPDLDLSIVTEERTYSAVDIASLRDDREGAIC